jgi:predicted RNase H-like HicB family nuclease
MKATLAILAICTFVLVASEANAQHRTSGQTHVRHQAQASASPVSAQDRSIVDSGLPSYAPAHNQTIALGPTLGHGATIDDLLKNADELLHEAKRDIGWHVDSGLPSHAPAHNQTIVLGPTLGHGATIDDLLKNADELLHEAKRDIGWHVDARVPHLGLEPFVRPIEHRDASPERGATIDDLLKNAGELAKPA